ncbi:MAG: septum formation protein Maf [Xanthomonadaceae bacterium]|nr:septum formation protein Maf [Xanthomonadaceae bacterium]
MPSPSSQVVAPLILASTSPYRRELLSRLGLDFSVARPETDETPQPGETPEALAVRLAAAKAEAVLGRAAFGGDGAPANAWAIGSDQVAELDGRPLGKPGSVENAVAQLAAMSGRSVRFLTALCLAGPGGRRFEALDVTVVRFRTLAPDEIARYVERERPLDCAGSFKSEGLGIALFDAIDTQDPTALIGLPLIATARLLREAGYAIP